MFPGSAKLWLEAQPQAENRGCLQISFRVFKNFFFFFRAARRPWRGTTDNMDNSSVVGFVFSGTFFGPF